MHLETPLYSFKLRAFNESRGLAIRQADPCKRQKSRSPGEKNGMFGALPKYIPFRSHKVMSPFVMFIVKQCSGPRGGNGFSVNKNQTRRLKSRAKPSILGDKVCQTRPSLKKKKERKKKG